MEPNQNKRRIRSLLLAGSLAVLAVVALVTAGFFFLRDRQLAVREPIRIELIAQFPGSSAEEVEGQVTIPLELALAGMEDLKILRSKSVPGVACLQVEFLDSVEFAKARQEVINRLQFVQNLPQGVNPLISPLSSTGEIYRYTLTAPRNPLGQDVYSLNDLKALQDWTLEREFKRIPHIIDVSSVGGTVKRYEIHPDPERLRRYGVTLTQLENAVASSNANVGGDFLRQGGIAQVVRGVGVFGGGRDPLEKAFAMKSPAEAAAYLHAEEQARLREIRTTVIVSVNNVPIRVDDIVEGGSLLPEAASTQGVVVGRQPRQGRVGVSRVRTDAGGRVVRDERGKVVCDEIDDCVQGVVYLRRGPDAEAAWRDVRAKIKQLSTPGRMLPGVRLDPYLEGTGPPDHFWVRAHFPVTISEEQAAALARRARGVVCGYPEVDRVVSEVGGSEGGSLPGSFHVGSLCVTLRPAGEWPKVADNNRPWTKPALMDALAAELERQFPGVGWDCLSQYRQDLSGEFAGSAEETVLKILGSDLDELEKLAGQAKPRLEKLAGVRSVRILPIRGLPQLTLRIDRDKCARHGIPTADVNYVLRCALEGKTISKMIEGEKEFDISLRWPAPLRRDKEAILALPLDIVTNQGIPFPGAAAANELVGKMPRPRLREVVSPLGENGAPDKKGAFAGTGVAALYREQGQRVLLLRVGVRGRAQSAVCAEAGQSIAPLLKPGYRLEWDK